MKNGPLYTASLDKIRFIAVSKVVLMYVPGTREYFGTTRPNDLISTDRVAEIATNQPEGSVTEVLRDSVIESVHCIRVAGEWKMLH